MSGELAPSSNTQPVKYSPAGETTNETSSAISSSAVKAPGAIATVPTP